MHTNETTTSYSNKVKKKKNISQHFGMISIKYLFTAQCAGELEHKFSLVKMRNNILYKLHIQYITILSQTTVNKLLQNIVSKVCCHCDSQ